MNSIRGYIPEISIYRNEFFEDYIASHSIFKDQKIKIRVINNSIIEDRNVKSAIDSAIFKISFIEHPNIIKIIDVVEENDSLAVFYENKDLLKLNDIIKEFTFDEKLSQISKIIEAIEYLNNKSLLLGIFSPDLFYFDKIEAEVILGEIGLLSIIYNSGNDELKQKFHNEFPFFNRKYTNNSKIDSKTDSYVAGRIMYNVLCSDDPNSFSQLPANIQNLINSTFEKDPLLRPKIHEINSFLKIISNKNEIPEPIQSQIFPTETVENNNFINEDFEIIETNNHINSSESQNTVSKEDNFNENKTEVESFEYLLDEFEELHKKVTVEDNKTADVSSNNNFQNTFRENRDNPPKFEYKPNTKLKQPDFVSPLALSFFAIFASIFLSFIGIILALVSLSKLSKQKKIVRFEHKRALTGSEISVSKVTTFLDIISIIIGFLVFLSWIS